jgi:hypothetical protein
MTEQHDVPAQVEAALEHVDELRPAEELAVYEQVLVKLTELLNAPDERGPGNGIA